MVEESPQHITHYNKTKAILLRELQSRIQMMEKVQLMEKQKSLLSAQQTRQQQQWDDLKQGVRQLYQAGVKLSAFTMISLGRSSNSTDDIQAVDSGSLLEEGEELSSAFQPSPPVYALHSSSRKPSDDSNYGDDDDDQPV